MPTPRGSREGGSKTQEQNGYRFDGIGLKLVESRFLPVIENYFFY